MKDGILYKEQKVAFAVGMAVFTVTLWVGSYFITMLVLAG